MQLKSTTKASDHALQKAQKLFMKSAYAMLEACDKASVETRATLVHAMVLLLSGNRELNLRRRELLKPDLNARYAALCTNPKTPITSELFGNDIGKEIDDLSKANRLSKRIASTSRGRRASPYNRSERGRGFRDFSRRGLFQGRYADRSQSFLSERPVYKTKYLGQSTVKKSSQK